MSSSDFFLLLCNYFNSVYEVIPREQGLYIWRANVLWENDLRVFLNGYVNSTENRKDKLASNDMEVQIQFALSPSENTLRLSDNQLDKLKESFSKRFTLVSELVSEEPDLVGTRVWYFKDQKNRYFSIMTTVRKWVIIQQTRREYLFDYYRQYMQLQHLSILNLYGYRFRRYWRTTNPAPRKKDLVKAVTHIRFPSFQDVEVQ